MQLNSGNFSNFVILFHIVSHFVSKCATSCHIFVQDDFFNICCTLYRVVKHLLKKNVQIIALKHCFVQNDGGLANDCTEALNESIVSLGGQEYEHWITLRP